MSVAISPRDLQSAASQPAVPRARWWVQLLLIAWLAWVYDITTNLAPLRRAAAFSHGASLLSLERALHLDPELTLNRWLAGHHTLALIASDWYDNAHFVVTFGVLGWLWWRRPDLYPSLRNLLIVINLLAFAVFLIYPVAPPRLLPGQGFADLVASTHAFGGWHSGALAKDANQFAAMPSLHLGWAVWSALAVWLMIGRGRARWLVVVYPLLTAVAVMATGNHYLLDVLAGVATAVVAVVWCERAWPRVWAAAGGPGVAAGVRRRLAGVARR